ncbi:MAG: phosphate acyltransferase PlsX [Oscillospiraceae bacterium]
MSVKIIVDGFGGDNAPLSVLQGCALAVKEYGVELIVTGDVQKLRQTAKENKIPLDQITLFHASDVIGMDDDPTALLKTKKDCSMAAAFRLLSEGEGDAFVSGGSTGAIVVGANFIIKRIKGIKRAGLATVIPTINGCYILMDAGATLDCKPETLTHFGIMGSIYMNKIMCIESPRVGLVNVGTEDTKGGELQVNAFAMMKEAPMNFIGNIEARDIPAGMVDVAVADGFTGNVILKLTEGLGSMFSKKIKDMFMEGIGGKLSALILMKKIKAFKASMDYTEYGGAPLLGVKKPVIKAHGSSNAKAFKNAIRQAKIFAENNLIETIEESIDLLKVEE